MIKYINYFLFGLFFSNCLSSVSSLEDREENIFFKTVIERDRQTLTGSIDPHEETTLQGVGAALSSNPPLYSLVLENCDLKELDIKIIATFLKNSPTLEILNLKGNSIDGQGAQDLGKALATNTSLKHLDVSHNKVSSDGLLGALGSGLLKRETFLDFLSFEGNSFVYVAQEALNPLFSVTMGYLNLDATIELSTIQLGLKSQKRKRILRGLKIPSTDSVVPVIREILPVAYDYGIEIVYFGGRDGKKFSAKKLEPVLDSKTLWLQEKGEIVDPLSLKAPTLMSLASSDEILKYFW